jgi:hypothetical protein
LQDQVNDVNRRKFDSTEFIKEVKKLEENIKLMRLDIDNHGNHFAMVENFVEKYVPIRI